ncbi:MAG: HNH endonuclease [Bacteroidota bacterium]
MALFIQKPILWNTYHYLRPSGVIATSGYPRETGYGHEEWNNSPRLLLKRGKERFRVFHTERIGSAPLDENAGQTFVFMTVSHDGVQQLVGIAGNAIGLSQKRDKTQREEIVQELHLGELWEDAWALKNVQEQFGGNQNQFLSGWRRDLHWIPNWICPDNFYWWLDEPVTLNARAITGKSKLLSMFGSYTEWDLPTVGRVLDSIPRGHRTEKWARLVDAMQCAPTDPLDADDRPDGEEPITDVLTRANARRGQGQFRENLMKVWNGACAVSGIDCRELLIASHIKPWKKSTPKQKLDRLNGLLLSANLDALFDKGLITFDEDGNMHLSPRLDSRHREVLRLPQPLRFVPKGVDIYLRYHRDNVFQR